MTTTNMTKRAMKALEVLQAGGRFSVRLERNYMGYEQFKTRLLTKGGTVVPGVGSAAKRELSGLLVTTGVYSGCTDYGLREVA